MVLFPYNVNALLFSVLMPNTLKNTQKTLLVMSFFSHIKILSHAIWDFAKNVKNTENTRIWWGCSVSQLRVLFMSFMILESKKLLHIHEFLRFLTCGSWKNYKTPIIHVSRNLLFFPSIVLSIHFRFFLGNKLKTT